MSHANFLCWCQSDQVHGAVKRFITCWFLRKGTPKVFLQLLRFSSVSSVLYRTYLKGGYFIFLRHFNLLETKRNLVYIRSQPYRAVNTIHHGYKNQTVNAV